MWEVTKNHETETKREEMRERTIRGERKIERKMKLNVVCESLFKSVECF
jgi:hypothetical protein